MRILLLGNNGQVGWELRSTLAPLAELITTSRGGDSDHHLDTSDLSALQHTLDKVRADVIVNATAYTAVDRAESEPDLAMRLNAEVPEALGRWAAQHGALVVHYSTDYVFDGSSTRPYRETDTPNPLSVYGRTKLAGDQALLASGCRALILRVSWVYGLRGHNFLLTMQRLMRERDSLNIVDDQIGAPTWCRSIARNTASATARLQDDRSLPGGIYNMAPHGATSWFGFAEAIRDELGLACELSPITTDQYPTPAVRPKNSRLDSSRLRDTFGLALADWREDLHACLRG